MQKSSSEIRYYSVASVVGFASFFLTGISIVSLLGLLDLHLSQANQLLMTAILPQIITLLLILAVACGFYGQAGGLRRRLGIEKHQPLSARQTVTYFLFMVVLTILLSQLTLRTAEHFGVHLEAQTLIKVLQKASPGTILDLLFSAVILAPVLEELLFRHLLFKRLSMTLPVPAAAILSAALFSVVHLNLLQMLSLFGMALILQLMYLRTKSIFVPICFHAANNLLAILMVILMRLTGSF